MAYSQEGVDNIPFFWCDTATDKDNIPKNDRLITGSKAFIVETGDLKKYKKDTQE